MTANIENLIPNEQRSPEELRAMTRKGGIASGEARRKKRSTREIIEAIFNSKAPEPLIKKLQEQFPDLDIKTIEDLMNAAMMRQVVKGNTKAYSALYDRKEGRPNQSIEMKADININPELTPEERKMIDELKKKLKD